MAVIIGGYEKTLDDGRIQPRGATVPVKIEPDPAWTQTNSMEMPRVQDETSDAHEQRRDAELLRQSAAGNGKAFHALVDRHADRLYRLAVSLVGNAADADDVLQEALAGAYRGSSGFEGRASVKTWLTRILVMQATKWRRERTRRGGITGHSIDENVLSNPAAGDASFASLHGGAGLVESRIDVQAALRRLSAEHRDVVVLREFEHLSYEQIAQVLDVPRGTVESRLHRARAELKELLKAYLP